MGSHLGLVVCLCVLVVVLTVVTAVLCGEDPRLALVTAFAGLTPLQSTKLHV